MGPATPQKLSSCAYLQVILWTLSIIAFVLRQKLRVYLVSLEGIKYEVIFFILHILARIWFGKPLERHTRSSLQKSHQWTYSTGPNPAAFSKGSIKIFPENKIVYLFKMSALEKQGIYTHKYLYTYTHKNILVAINLQYALFFALPTYFPVVLVCTAVYFLTLPSQCCDFSLILRPSPWQAG